MAFPGLRVLVVDDEAVVRNLLRDALGFWGCEVDVAVDGEVGVDKYRQYHPDLLLMDLDMPVKGGFEATKEILELDPQALIILITGFSETSLARETLRKGLVKAVIPKPFELDQLRMAIQYTIKNRTAPSKVGSEKDVVGCK